MVNASALRLVHGARGSSAVLEAFQGHDDADLVAAVLSGDAHAFEALYRRHARFALNLVVRIQGSSHDVEDLVHDAFVKVHSKLAELRDPAAFRGWLGAIVVRLLRTRLRHERIARLLGLSSRADHSVEMEALAADDASPEVRAQLAQVYALLRMMPTDLRITWALRFIEDHRLEAVAELSGCSLATAKRRLVRAQKFLEQHFVDPQMQVLR